MGSLFICFNAHFPDEHSARIRFFCFVYSIQAEVTVFPLNLLFKKLDKKYSKPTFFLSLGCSGGRLGTFFKMAAGNLVEEIGN